MRRHSASLVLGYHGCSRSVGMKAVELGAALEKSDKDYDWLGPGVYFWENDPQRALEWATEKQSRGEVDEPFVIGAIIDLGNCLDLLVRENLELLATAFGSLSKMSRRAGVAIPKNRDTRSTARGDKLLRYRDCAVIRHLHLMVDDRASNPLGPEHAEPFDTVRGLFVEGRRAYPGGGFYSKTHTQIAVLSDHCIKGLFVPR